MNFRERAIQNEQFKRELQLLLEKYGKDKDAGCSSKTLADYLAKSYNSVTYVTAELRVKGALE